MATAVEEIPISKFKATCLSTLEKVRRTRIPIRVTRFGQPVAEIVPPSLPPRPKRWLGSAKGTVRILGDIVGPIGDISDWEAGR
jgi:antitoxin (DNA-binding transcriptional repressor) of toxin-antitoxin stability system